ncbi:hypothetical protein DQ04_05101020 [Trypanosoma grayi]|uniref:hypothetical protein n=1 Tax=Trypanosoma grayi TaxID=71804 RepID=UPI0004F411A6|nr:hypothetical protein DQ04_05101020 [Trypanosoma grayi]KEG09510.1 hypothetical protein DQ04_05101020 [Trypanosoma grayi]
MRRPGTKCDSGRPLPINRNSLGFGPGDALQLYRGKRAPLAAFRGEGVRKKTSPLRKLRDPRLKTMRIVRNGRAPLRHRGSLTGLGHAPPLYQHHSCGSGGNGLYVAFFREIEKSREHFMFYIGKSLLISHSCSLKGNTEYLLVMKRLKKDVMKGNLSRHHAFLHKLYPFAMSVGSAFFWTRNYVREIIFRRGIAP